MIFDPDGPQSFRFLAAPADLRERVNSLFVLQTDDDHLREIMPAYSAQIYIFLRGSGAMQFASQKQRQLGPVFFITTMLEASPFVLEGPVRCVGASLSHLGWATLAGLPVDEVHDQTLLPEEIFSKPAAQRLMAIAQHEPDDIDTVVAKLCDFIRDTQVSLPPLHSKLISQTTQWLSSSFSPSLDALYDQVSLSRRHVQRLSKQYFGAPPAGLLKRFRGVRAAILLSHPNLPEEAREEVFAAYFDQAHLIRDIRRYAGRTPTVLDRGSLVGNTFDPDGHGVVAKPVRASLSDKPDFKSD